MGVASWSQLSAISVWSPGPEYEQVRGFLAALDLSVPCACEGCELSMLLTSIRVLRQPATHCHLPVDLKLLGLPCGSPGGELRYAGQHGRPKGSS